MRLKFVTSSDIPDKALTSFVLEARADDKQIADVLCLDGKWYVTMMTETGIVRVSWEDFLLLVHRFSEFVAQENETMLQDALAGIDK
jgi:hypothetical protein